MEGRRKCSVGAGIRRSVQSSEGLANFDMDLFLLYNFVETLLIQRLDHFWVNSIKEKTETQFCYKGVFTYFEFKT